MLVVGLRVEVGVGDVTKVGLGVVIGVGLVRGGVGEDVGLGVGVGVGTGRLLFAYFAAPIIKPLVLSIVVETTLPFSSIPSMYPLVGSGI